MTADFRNRIVGTGSEKPDQLLANPGNWRIHPDQQKQVLTGVMREIGWVQNVIVNKTTGHIVDGHLRVKLAIESDQREIPVVYVELTEEEENLILATLDPVAGLAATDQAMLDEILLGLEPEDQALADFLDTLAGDDSIEPETEGQTGDDDAPAPQGSSVSAPGDVWVLGDHRLMCGDSTNIEHVERLMEGKQADMVWTDPPYNVDYEGAGGKKIQNDNQEDELFRIFLRDALSSALPFTKEGGAIYVAHADSEGYNFRGALIEAGWLLKQCLVWVKNSFTIGRQDYQWKHEPILYGWRPGAAHQWYGEFNKPTVIDDDTDVSNLQKPDLVRLVNALRNAFNTTVIREPKPARNAEHPTMKPVALVLHMIKNSSKRGELVLDLFGGSGSTLIACEKIGRRSNLMEMDPIYCDVIIRRFQEFTGKQAFLYDGTTFDELAEKRDAI